MKRAREVNSVTPPRPPLPPLPKKLKDFKITKEQALVNTREAKDRLFSIAKKDVYRLILGASNNGDYSISCYFNGSCRRGDVKTLQQELIEKGFEVEYIEGVNKELNLGCGVGIKKIQSVKLNYKTFVLYYQSLEEIKEIYNWLWNEGSYNKQYWDDIEKKLREPILKV